MNVIFLNIHCENSALITLEDIGDKFVYAFFMLRNYKVFLSFGCEKDMKVVSDNRSGHRIRLKNLKAKDNRMWEIIKGRGLLCLYFTTARYLVVKAATIRIEFALIRDNWHKIEP